MRNTPTAAPQTSLFAGRVLPRKIGFEDAGCHARIAPCARSVAAHVQVTSYPYYLANEPVQGKKQLDVTDKYSGQVAYRVAVASPEEISR